MFSLLFNFVEHLSGGRHPETASTWICWVWQCEQELEGDHDAAEQREERTEGHSSPRWEGWLTPFFFCTQTFFLFSLPLKNLQIKLQTKVLSPLPLSNVYTCKKRSHRHVKDPVLHVRVRWIMETHTQKNPHKNSVHCSLDSATLQPAFTKKITQISLGKSFNGAIEL